MKKAWMIAIIPGVMAIMVGIFIVVLLLLKLLWAWTVPDLFPGAVEAGLVAGTISWYTSFKVAIFVAVLAGVAGARGERHHHIESVVVEN